MRRKFVSKKKQRTFDDTPSKFVGEAVGKAVIEPTEGKTVGAITIIDIPATTAW